MNDVTSIIIKIVIGVLFALITRYFIPYLKTLKDDARWKRLIDMVQTAVEAAEQTIRDKGSIKKEEVTVFVTTWLRDQGVNVDSEEIDKLIESAVYKMNERKQKSANTIVNL